MLSYRLEGDPDFANVGSEGFVRKFLHHDILIVANIAAALIALKDKEKALEEMKVQLGTLREEERTHLERERQDREYNRMYSPGKWRCIYQDCYL